MKILLIGDTSGNPDEGMKKVSYRLCEQLNKFENCQVKFISLKEVIQNRRQYNNTDIIHFMSGPTWRTFIYGWVIKKILHKTPLTLMSFIHPKWSKLTDMSFKFFHPDAAIVQTKKWRMKVQQKVKFIGEIPLAGINLKKFHTANEIKKKALKVELNLPLDKIILLHVGHLNTGRNLSVLKQFKSSKTVYPVVIGSSTVSANNDLVNSLERSGVKIIKGYIPEIEKFYMAADCYIFPTIDANFAIQIPLSVLEALACNVPVISTPYEALPNYVTENPPFINYYDSFDRLEDNLKNICSAFNYNDDSQVSEVLSKFGWATIASEIHSFYKRLLN